MQRRRRIVEATKGRFRGHLKATGVKPVFVDRLADIGTLFDDDLFVAEEFIRRSAAG